MEWATWALAGVTTIGLPTISWTVRKITNLDTRVETHEQVDTLRFANIDTGLKEVKEGQKETNQKLDRLIERFL
jgi:hypothetical protein